MSFVLSVVYVYFHNLSPFHIHVLIYINLPKHKQTHVSSKLKVTERVSGDYALMRRSAFSGM